MIKFTKLTKQDLIDKVAERWKAQYFNTTYSSDWWNYNGHDREITYKQLLALSNPTEEDISNIIGNKSWTRLQCDECGKDVRSVVIIDVTDGEYTTYICQECIEKMLESIKE